MPATYYTPPAAGFERDLTSILDQHFPYCVMSNILLFKAASTSINEMGYEIDNLLHYQLNGINYLIIVEAKNQLIDVYEQRWYARYDGEDKDVGIQLIKQARALLSYLAPFSSSAEVRIEGWIVSSDERTPIPPSERVDDQLSINLTTFRTFRLQEMLRIPKCLRVEQSEFLNLLRLGSPVATLGHPELRNAISYISRCRRSLDRELFRSFSPSRRKWAINGSAGMGKSVLLAYSLCAFASNRQVDSIEEGRISLVDLDPSVARGLPDRSERTIYAYAMKPKQTQVLEQLYRRSVEQFLAMDGARDIQFCKIVFGVWNGTVPPDCNVLALDEAHDLSDVSQDVVAKWIAGETTSRYLLLACDRHQKLRLLGRNEPIVRGVNFSGFTTKLHRNYRNPFPVFAAGLALMFRWFAGDGPKVIPSKTDMVDGFGFAPGEVDGYFTMRNDAHPANNWSHSVGQFPSCASAYAYLAQVGFAKQEILWARFSNEDPEFDYERLSTFTYHNFNSSESADLVDKYVKGQEFEVVVIEGFPDLMDQWDGSGSSTAGTESERNASERKMWQFRKQIYLCCSRARGFLYFVPSALSNDAGTRIGHEIDILVQTLSLPLNRQYASGKTWGFRIGHAEVARTMDVFQDEIATLRTSEAIGENSSDEIIAEEESSTSIETAFEKESEENDSQDPVSSEVVIENTQYSQQTQDLRSPLPEPQRLVLIRVARPLLIKKLAKAMGLKPYVLIKDLVELNLFADQQTTVGKDIARRIAGKHGFQLAVQSSESSSP